MKITTSVERFFSGIDKVRESGGICDYLLGSHKIVGGAIISGVEAEFEYSDGELTVNIIDKPLLVSESTIEDKIKEFFN